MVQGDADESTGVVSQVLFSPIFFNKTILQFYLDGLQYALGDLKADATPTARLSPQPTPAFAPEKK